MIILDTLKHLLDPMVAVGWLLGGLFAHRWWQAALAAVVWSQVVYALLSHFMPEPDLRFDPLFAAGTAGLYAIAALVVFAAKRVLYRLL